MTELAETGWRSVVGKGPRVRSGTLGLLDIGSSKLCCYIARPRSGRGIVLLGRGYQGAEGLRSGEIIDAEAAESAVTAVLHEAEQQAGETLREVYLVVSGGRPESVYVRVTGQLYGRAVAEHDVAQLLARARRAGTTAEREVLHAVPVEMRVDGGRIVRDPIGMSGNRLELVVHLVTVVGASLRNLLACLERCHIGVKGVVSGGYAAGIACLSEEEMDRGCIVVDMGGGTTNLAHFSFGRLALVDQVPYGGDHVTMDLAYGLSTSRVHAERIKTLYGTTVFRSCDDNRRIEVPLLGDHADLPTGEVAQAQITEIVRARVEEIFRLLAKRLDRHDELLATRPPRSVVLTGGASQLEGVAELAEEVLGLPTRCGRPGVLHARDGIESSPCCACASGAVGLILGDDGGLGWTEHVELPFLGQRLARLGQWFKENF